MSSGPNQQRRPARPRPPQATAARELEAASRRQFEEAVTPWPVTPWKDADFGIDALVEITRPQRDTANRAATGIRFAVQLKASASDDILSGIRVKPSHVLYWCQNTEPVLLVACHVPSRRLAARWVDDALLSELGSRDPAWMGRSSVTVSFLNARSLSAESMPELERHASSDSRVRRPLAPGTFFGLQRELAAVANLLEALALQVGFETVTTRIQQLRESLRAATYVVAIAGPSRAGKSTLLNALLGAPIAPVGRLPTTAVSILIVAGAEAKAVVEFKSGDTVSGPGTSEYLEPYATQAGNPDNQKEVRGITVTLVNEALERGVAYLDAPGLHDPSEDIRAVTEEALRHANAIVYVLDGSPARDGGFFLSRHAIDDIHGMLMLSRHVFLVVNKMDVVPQDRVPELKQYVETELAKYSISDRLAHPPIFMSGQSYSAERERQAPSNGLEGALWAHLLATRSTGLERLAYALTEMERAGQDFQSLVSMRRADGTEAHEVLEALARCRQAARTLVARLGAATKRDIRDLKDDLERTRVAIAANVHDTLAAMPVTVALPSAEAIRDDTHKALLAGARAAWQRATARREVQAGRVRRDVEKALQQARTAVGVPVYGQILVPSLTLSELPGDPVPQAWIGAFTFGLVGLVLHPVFGLVGLILGAIGGAFSSREERRRARISEMDTRVTKGLTQAVGAISEQMVDRILQHERDLRRHADDRISVYTREMERQVAGLGVPLPPHQQEELRLLQEKLERCIESMRSIRASMP